MKPLYRYAFFALLAVVLIQQGCLYFGGRGRRAERITAANELAAHSVTERRLVAQLQIATRYIYQGQITLAKVLRDHATPKVDVGLKLEPRLDSGSVAAPLIAVGTSVHFISGWGSLDSTGYRVENDATIDGVGPIVGLHPHVTIGYKIAFAPVNFRVLVSCEGFNARVRIAGPKWRDITIDSTSRATEETCNPASTHWQPFTFRAPSLPWLAVAIGFGFVLRGALPH